MAVKKLSKMETLTILPNTLIRAKGTDISIGRRTDQVALFSQQTGQVHRFDRIIKGGRLSKIKRQFKTKIRDSVSFFFEDMDAEDIKKLISILK